jgi:hypothetical protein
MVRIWLEFLLINLFSSENIMTKLVLTYYFFSTPFVFRLTADQAVVAALAFDGRSRIYYFDHNTDSHHLHTYYDCYFSYPHNSRFDVVCFVWSQFFTTAFRSDHTA